MTHEVHPKHRRCVVVLNNRQSIRRMPVNLSIRMREIDCMLADIDAQIQRLQQERIYLRLAQKELTDMLYGQPTFEIPMDERLIGASGGEHGHLHKSLSQQRGR